MLSLMELEFPLWPYTPHVLYHSVPIFFLLQSRTIYKDEDGQEMLDPEDIQQAILNEGWLIFNLVAMPPIQCCCSIYQFIQVHGKPYLYGNMLVFGLSHAFSDQIAQVLLTFLNTELISCLRRGLHTSITYQYG